MARPMHALLALMRNPNRDFTEEEQKQLDEFLKSRQARYGGKILTHPAPKGRKTPQNVS